ncbi:MAG: D-alanyl-D-alanine carboxypeptidase [Alphaproteobacteria bacterium]|nr:D-alanyl-D-alanine carboxypeptidase [Alphaproteobacteria bacterium]
MNLSHYFIYSFWSFLIACLFLFFLWTRGACAKDTIASNAILINETTGVVLMEKNADQRRPPASLLKLMTIELIFKALDENRLTLAHKFRISKKAVREGGPKSGNSTMFTKYNSEISLENLLQGIIVHSGNDASIAVAEGMAGSEKAFATLMNERAHELGLHNSYFVNSTGLPAKGQYTSARDISKLVLHIIRRYPRRYWRFGQTHFTWNKITQRNRNFLLGKVPGVDGLKTGYTKAAGYCLVTSGLRKQNRLVAILMGLKDAKKRTKEGRRMMEWGFTLLDQMKVIPAEKS